ncbi:hypothetical protein OHA40_28160 [Nocardia sp. NBC_00508]|uniref:hypothetical protein n=1 Tax=Nocardia sp. NBC_00508 TaxID=2975992 RepID=UPI002E7FCC69|nr:hypothetical protein [Nocardia sp. NBC_00508]WUD65462.1 hypothetical protein OHA40_28160 [Nocardia sp. NBC_00508]
MMRGKTFGFVRRDRSVDPDGDGPVVRAIAARDGYGLVVAYLPGAEIDPGPTLWLLQRVHTNRVPAVIVPNFTHLGAMTQRVLRGYRDLVTSEQILPGRVAYPSAAQWRAR